MFQNAILWDLSSFVFVFLVYPEMAVSITKYAHVFANKRCLFNLKTFYSVIYKYSYCFQTQK